MDMSKTWRTPTEKRAVVAYWWNQQQGICCICKSTDIPMEPYQRDLAKNPVAATIEHLIPKRDRGTNTVGNVRLAHAACNHELGALWMINQSRIANGQEPLSEAAGIERARLRMLDYLETIAARAEYARARLSASTIHLPTRMTPLPIPERKSKPVKFTMVRTAALPIAETRYILKHGKKAWRRKMHYKRAEPTGLPRGATLPGYIPEEERPPPQPAPKPPPASAIFERRNGKTMPAPKFASRPICAKCGSDRIRKDAQLQWDTERQTWVIAEQLNTFDCADCEDDTTVAWK